MPPPVSTSPPRSSPSFSGGRDDGRSAPRPAPARPSFPFPAHLVQGQLGGRSPPVCPWSLPRPKEVARTVRRARQERGGEVGHRRSDPRRTHPMSWGKGRLWVSPPPARTAGGAAVCSRGRAGEGVSLLRSGSGWPPWPPSAVVPGSPEPCPGHGRAARESGGAPGPRLGQAGAPEGAPGEADPGGGQSPGSVRGMEEGCRGGPRAVCVC